MLKKNIRLRREYLQRIEDEKKVKTKYDQKMKIKLADAGKRESLSIFSKKKHSD
jgi:U3 small nucleolar ribonucleoprotein protein IMP4